MSGHKTVPSNNGRAVSAERTFESEIKSWPSNQKSNLIIGLENHDTFELLRHPNQRFSGMITSVIRARVHSQSVKHCEDGTDVTLLQVLVRSWNMNELNSAPCSYTGSEIPVPAEWNLAERGSNKLSADICSVPSARLSQRWIAADKESVDHLS